jgi:hypothetical protein
VAAEALLGEQDHSPEDGQRTLPGETLRDHEAALPVSLSQQRHGRACV